MHKTKVVLVIGPPGSGKGSQCKILSNNTGMMHISTGDLCRDAIRKKTDLGNQVAEYMNGGDLVPDDLMISVIEERLREPDALSQGVLLDGYPRTIRQAKALKDCNSLDIDRVILIQASNNVCTDRILSRRMDPETGDSYSLKFQECACNEPNVSQRLVQRDNDKDVSIIDTRLKYFYMNLGQILQFFKGRIFAVDGSGDIKRVNTDMMKALMEPIVETDELEEEQESKYSFRNPRKYPGPQSKPKHKEQLCAICRTENADHIIIPCGHKCGCESCLSQVFGRDKSCPICRRVMTGFVKVYNSGVEDSDEEGEKGEEEMENDIDAELVERVENDGGWGLSDAITNHNILLSAFERRMSDSLEISINPCDNVSYDGKNGVNVAVTIRPPDLTDITQRVPVDICCVIDTSASMALDATFQDPNNETKTVSEGLMILDIVKHSVKTVIHTLTEIDRISIVSFNSKASLVLPLTELNAAGKRSAINALDRLNPDGQTNIWDGLECGLNSLRVDSDLDTRVPRKKNVFLLTDGQPNLSPPMGEEMTLRRYFESYPDLKCQLHTFGFGYTLYSDLLLSIATTGKGCFSFIPDAKIVGTCFVNAISNACSVFSQDCKVHLVAKGGALLNGEVSGLLPCENVAWGKVVHLGSLYYGQSRDIIVSMNIPGINRMHDDKGKEEMYSNLEPVNKKAKEEVIDSDYLEVIVEYESNTVAKTHKIVERGSSRLTTPDSVVALVRNSLVSTSYDVISKCSFGKGVEGVDAMKSLIGLITAYKAVNPDPRLGLMLDDVAGRMSKAISTAERFKRWGGHYLRAITRAHQLQLCTNFMDPGLQGYGGSLFSKLRDDGGKIFLTLDLQRSNNRVVAAPRSTGSGSGSRSGISYTPPSRISVPPPSSTTYYSGKGGGCFDETCWVWAKDNEEQKGWEKRKMSELKRGDMVIVATSEPIDKDGFRFTTTRTAYAKIRFVVRIDRTRDGKDKAQDLIKFMDSGLMVTKKHPIRPIGQWELPMDLVDGVNIVPHPSTSKYIYNVVLDEEEVGLFVNNIECVTFGHYIKEVWHPFFGSSEVVKYIESVADSNGFATVDSETLKVLANSSK